MKVRYTTLSLIMAFLLLLLWILSGLKISLLLVSLVLLALLVWDGSGIRRGKPPASMPYANSGAHGKEVNKMAYRRRRYGRGRGRVVRRRGRRSVNRIGFRM